MAKKRKNTTPAAPVGYYDETRIEWVQNEPNVYIAINLDEPDQAMVAHVMLPKVPVRRWMFRASDGTLIERQISEIGDAGIIVNEFNAQQLAIKWLNERREINAVQQPNTEDRFLFAFGDGQMLPNPNYKEPEPQVELGDVIIAAHVDAEGVKVIDKMRVVEVRELGGITRVAIEPPNGGVVMGVDVALEESQTVLTEWFPRDPMTGKPITERLPDPPPPPPDPTPSPDDEPEPPPTPKRGRKR